MTLNYSLIVDVDDVGFLSAPFLGALPVPGLYDRVWINRGRFLNRYTGEVELLTDPIGFGDGVFGSGLFGWS